MHQFSIADLERYTQIKAHTFRTWEQRYNLTKSKRGQNGLRFFTIDDLDFFLDFSLLNRFGYKVSKIALLNREEIRERAFQLTEETARKENIVNKLIVYMFSLETEAFESTVNHVIGKYGIDVAVEDVLLSFIERTDLFSYSANSATAYHFAVAILRKKMMVAIEQARAKRHLAKTALLFLPEGEHFDLILLYLQYKFQLAGVKSFYLGNNIQLRQLSAAVQEKLPDYLVTFIHSGSKNLLRKLMNSFPDYTSRLLVATEQLPVYNHTPAGDFKLSQYKHILQEVEARR
ncbi:MAG TPA: MerR family transcriptional regulator [Flavisolibacter sp.]|nr:MerR family transcriptional regulator [Flavisolibacter sp.]